VNKRTVTAAAVTLLLALFFPAHPARAESNVGGIRSDLRNERTIRKLYEEFTAAWNRHDTNAMGDMWALDGDHLEPDGHLAKGRAEVQALLNKQHATVFKDSHLGLKIDSVWFITGDVALVDGSYEVSGIQDLEGHPIPTRRGHLTSVLLNERDKWWIAASRLMIPTTLPYRKTEGPSGAATPGSPAHP